MLHYVYVPHLLFRSPVMDMWIASASWPSGAVRCEHGVADGSLRPSSGLSCDPQKRVASPVAVLALVVWGAPRLFPYRSCRPAVLQRDAGCGSSRLHPTFIFSVVLLLCFWKQPFWDRCEVIPHCGFDLCIIFGEVSLRVLCLFSIGVFDFCCCWVIGVLYMFWTLTSYHIQFAIFSPIG